MDSDDISRPDRCERQLAVFAAHPAYSIVSGIVEEFSDTPDNISVRRVVPEEQSEIIAFAKKRNPFNHPCVMYKKSAVEAAGGYQDFYLLEDYYLWIRMLQNGFQGYNLQEPCCGCGLAATCINVGAAGNTFCRSIDCCSICVNLGSSQLGPISWGLLCA